MSEELFERKAVFISWCIEEYAAAYNQNGQDVANYFAEHTVLDFLGRHYEILHTQGKASILETISDYIKTGERQ